MTTTQPRTRPDADASRRPTRRARRTFASAAGIVVAVLVTAGVAVADAAQPSSPARDGWRVSWVMAIPETGVGVDALVVDVHTSGTVGRWQVRQTGRDDYRVFAYTPDGGEVVNSGPLPIPASGRLTSTTLHVTGPPDGLRWTLTAVDVATLDVTEHTDRLNGDHGAGDVTDVHIGATSRDGGGTLSGATIGRLHVTAADTEHAGRP